MSIDTQYEGENKFGERGEREIGERMEIERDEVMRKKERKKEKERERERERGGKSLGHRYTSQRHLRVSLEA